MAQSKLKRHNNDVVIFRDGRFLTLGEVFKSLSLTAYDLSVDTLDMHAGQDTFHRWEPILHAPRAGPALTRFGPGLTASTSSITPAASRACARSSSRPTTSSRGGTWRR